VISEFLAWLLFLKTRLCKEKRLHIPLFVGYLLPPKKIQKQQKKISKKQKQAKHKKIHPEYFDSRKKIFFSSPFKYKK